MDLNLIVQHLKDERNRVNLAIQALEGAGEQKSSRNGSGGQRRKLSKAARAKIAAAQRKRWAKLKAGKK